MYSKGAWEQLIEQYYTVYITYNKAYLIISEEQITNWSNHVKTYPWPIKTCLVLNESD